MAKSVPQKSSFAISLPLILGTILLIFVSALVYTVLIPAGVFSGHQITFCANSISCIKDLTGKPDGNDTGTFMGQAVTAPPSQNDDLPSPAIPTPTPDIHKHIEVDLTQQKLYAYEGSQLIYTFPISSGRYYVTPTGDFTIWIKLRYTRMIGGSKENNTYYDLPNVPYTMYFYNSEHPKGEGYAIHGAYWHHNFGHPMSHGCINLSPADAKLMYDWADPPTSGSVTYSSDLNPGTPIHIYGVTPTN